MRSDDIRDVLRLKPFQPFRLYVLENIAYEIRHPEQVLVGSSVIDIYMPDAEGAVSPPVRHVTISLLHISRVEFLPAAPSTNGE